MNWCGFNPHHFDEYSIADLIYDSFADLIYDFIYDPFADLIYDSFADPIYVSRQYAWTVCIV